MDKINNNKNFFKDTLAILLRNRYKFLISCLILIIILTSIIFIKVNNKKKISLIAENFLAAEILLKNEKKASLLYFTIPLITLLTSAITNKPAKIEITVYEELNCA